MALGVKIIEGMFGRLSERYMISSAKCVRIRHKAARCTDCMDACPENAIAITSAGGNVLVDWLRCSDCGKCLAVCSNGVFSLHGMERKRLLSAVASRITEGATVTLSCRQSPHASEATGSAGTLVHFNRRLLILMIAMGAERIAMFRGDCDDCGKGCAEIVSKEMAAVGQILALCGREVSIDLTECLAPVRDRKEHADGASAAFGHDALTSRREFFSHLKKRTLASVGSTIHYLTENDPKTKRTVLADDNTRTEIEEYITSLKIIGGEPLLGSMLAEGFLNEVHVNTESCILCGICFRICPHKVFTTITEMIKGLEKVVEIRRNSLLCTGCGLCVLSCPGKAIRIGNS